MTSMSSSSLSPEQVKAARALLAWSQQDLAGVARVSPSTIADFERGMRTPVANNAQAIREALEAKGLEFIAGGVVEKARLPSPPPIPRPGMLVRWVTATHLSQWGERRDGQSGMPELLRRLIYATVGPSAAVRFPSDESVQYPGWDGVCVASMGSGFVPSGKSVWEIGTQRTAIRAKANEDFSKRTADPIGHDPRKTTFVFVTPQRFVGKDTWVAEKKALGVWHDVAVIDGDDLVHWLEMCPAVSQWLSVKIGRRPTGLRNLEEVWAEWVAATTTPLTPEVLLTSRDEEQTAILKWLRAEPQLLAISAEAPDEAMAFLYAAINPLPEPYQLSYWSRCVVADTPETARELIGLGTPLIIVLTDPEAGLARRLTDDGHHVFAAYGPDVINSAQARRLPRPWKFDLQMALARAGLSDEDAHRYAHASGRSITVLRRLMPAAPSYRSDWSEHASPELIAAMFAGAWVETSVKDREILSALTGCAYEQVETVLAPLAARNEGPLVRLGDVWKVVSLRDLWSQIGRQVTSSQLVRFETTFQTVLGTINPRYSKPPKSIYYEEEGEFGDEPSAVLRHGLTEAMIALAVYPDCADLVTNVAGRVAASIRKLLDNLTPGLWWSLSSDLQNIAEAAPDVFLEALQAGLEGDDPPIMPLFRSDEGFMHPREYLANLLWSLEILARSPEYLMRSALMLAHLHQVDPGGRLGNRPFASLRRVFVSWSPQTYAGPTDRMKVIDRIVRDYPDVGWKLLLTLAPRFQDTSEPSSMPNWRDFTPDEPEEITGLSVAAAGTAIGQRLLHQVGNNAERWHALLDLWRNFDGKWRAAAVKQLGTFVHHLSDPAEIEAMRDNLRTLLRNHRGFKKAPWAMRERDLKPLDKVFKLLQPKSVEDRVRWLFRPGANQMRPGVEWAEQQAELQNQQIEAAESLVAELSSDRLFAFARTITMHDALGAAIAKTAVKDEIKHELIKQGLMSKEDAHADVGTGILYGLKHRAGDDGDAWIYDIWRRAIAEAWGDQAELRIVHCLPPTESTWADICARSSRLTSAYWETLPTFRIPGTANPNYVVDQLLAVGRSRPAIEWLGHNIKAKPDGAVLIRALHAATKSDGQSTGNDAVMLSHWVGTILDYLETADGVSEQDVVALEWMYFQALRYSPRPPRTLHRALAQDPEFFVYLLRLIFLPGKDSGIQEPEPENPEDAHILARQAYDVLHDWARVPGSNDEGIINAVALEDWVKSARKLLAEAGRGEIGDSRIGEILSAAKRGSDGPWPPEPVREIIEMTRSRALERGFEIGVYNRRGVTVRMPHDGGGQERALAECYRRYADALRFDWPRTSACLDRIAATYEVDANREDLSADQRDWL